MSLISLDISEAVDSFFPKEDSAFSAQKSHLKVKCQERINAITRDFFSAVERQIPLEEGQRFLPFCVKAVPLEIQLLRVTLIEEHNILSGAYLKDWKERVREETSTSYGTSSYADKEVDRKHVCENIFNLNEQLGWQKKEETAACWYLTLNSFVDEQGAPVGTSLFGGYRLGTVSQEVKLYIEEVSKVDLIVKKYSFLYEKWVQQKINSIAKKLAGSFSAQQKEVPSVRCESIFLSTELAINALCQCIFQQYTYNVMPEIARKTTGQIQCLVFDLTKELGSLERSEKSSLYALNFSF